VLALYFGVAIYGGFFGAGLGILTLAVLGLLGQEQIHEMNALTVLQASLINGVAVLTFALAGAVHWPIALLMAAGGIVGGYGGAALARRVNPVAVRWVIIVATLLVPVAFVVSGVGAWLTSSIPITIGLVILPWAYGLVFVICMLVSFKQ